MHKRLENIFAQRLNYLVLGDVMIDHYINGNIKRISPEAPVPVLTVEERTAMPGGAGNVAVNLSSLNADVTLMGFTGGDDSETQLTTLLSAKNIEFKNLRWNRGTISKTRVVAANQQIIRIDDEKTMSIDSNEYEALERLINTQNFTRLHGVIISDYNKGTCNPGLCATLIKQCRMHGIPVVVDPKGCDWNKYRGSSLITPNLKELGDVLVREIPNTHNAIEDAGLELIDRFDIDNLVVTRSEQGMTLISKEKKQCLHFPTLAREVSDVSGAGDTVAACLLRFMTCPMPLQDAIPIANMAAGIVVSFAGTHPIDMDLMLAESQKQLHISLKDARLAGKTIVFTNGCFDILHPGHTTYLSRARELGDYLVVGLNTDKSTKRLKGPSRPINNQQTRKTMLEALASVDKVLLFDEDTPLELIRSIRPDILVKGGDYRVEEVVGREYAGKTIILPFLKGHSTTGFLSRIRNTDG